jgi:selenocysteine lyase/cysteine desulfurase
MLTRRQLLTTAAAGGTAALAVAGCTSTKATTPAVSAPAGIASAPPLDPQSWDSLRAQFALAEDGVNLATFVFASHPAPVRAAIEQHRTELDRDPARYLANAEESLDEAVFKAAAGYLRTYTDQIALTDSTTMGLGLLYAGLQLDAGDEILTTEHDFYSTHESLRLRAVRDGVRVRRVRLYDEPESARAEQIVDRLVAAVGARTRVVAVTWVHSGTGVKLPVRAIADALRRVNADRSAGDRVLLCVDGVHGFGAEGTPADELGCDFLVSGCHKWLFGPRGTGLVWGRPDAWERYTPVIPSFTADAMGSWLRATTPIGPVGRLSTPGGYHSFEHRWALAPAFELHAAIGPARVAERTHALAAALKEGLATIAGVRVRTPRSADLSAGIVCCEVDGIDAPTALHGLVQAKVFASVTPYATSYLRFGTSIVNTESDVDAALAAVRALK